MLTVKQLRDNPSYIIERLNVKGFDAKNIIVEIIKLDDDRKAIQTKLDANLAEQNRIAKETGILFKQAKQTES